MPHIQSLDLVCSSDAPISMYLEGHELTILNHNYDGMLICTGIVMSRPRRLVDLLYPVDLSRQEEYTLLAVCPRARCRIRSTGFTDGDMQVFLPD